MLNWLSSQRLSDTAPVWYQVHIWLHRNKCVSISYKGQRALAFQSSSIKGLRWHNYISQPFQNWVTWIISQIHKFPMGWVEHDLSLLYAASSAESIIRSRKWCHHIVSQWVAFRSVTAKQIFLLDWNLRCEDIHDHSHWMISAPAADFSLVEKSALVVMHFTMPAGDIISRRLLNNRSSTVAKACNILSSMQPTIYYM